MIIVVQVESMCWNKENGELTLLLENLGIVVCSIIEPDESRTMALGRIRKSWIGVPNARDHMIVDLNLSGDSDKKIDENKENNSNSDKDSKNKSLLILTCSADGNVCLFGNDLQEINQLSLLQSKIGNQTVSGYEEKMVTQDENMIDDERKGIRSNNLQFSNLFLENKDVYHCWDDIQLIENESLIKLVQSKLWHRRDNTQLTTKSNHLTQITNRFVFGENGTIFQISFV